MPAQHRLVATTGRGLWTARATGGAECWRYRDILGHGRLCMSPLVGWNRGPGWLTVAQVARCGAEVETRESCRDCGSRQGPSPNCPEPASLGARLGDGAAWQDRAQPPPHAALGPGWCGAGDWTGWGLGLGTGDVESHSGTWDGMLVVVGGRWPVRFVVVASSLFFLFFLLFSFFLVLPGYIRSGQAGSEQGAARRRERPREPNGSSPKTLR